MAVLIADINRVYGWDLASAAPEGALEEVLAEKVNAMIRRDFGALVQLLYRIDVSEERLRRILNADTGEDAGRIIARLIMDRQWQKIESRRQYRRDDAGSDADADAERW